MEWFYVRSKLKNCLCKIVAKSKVVTKFNVSKSRLHCNFKRKEFFFSNFVAFSEYLTFTMSWCKIFINYFELDKIISKRIVLHLQWCRTLPVIVYQSDAAILTFFWCTLKFMFLEIPWFVSNLWIWDFKELGI